MLPNDPKSRQAEEEVEDNVDVNEMIDEDTGFPNPEHLDIDDISATREIASTRIHFEDMEATTGWAILMGFVGEEINTLLRCLRTERNMEKILRLQCMLEALELLPEIVSKLKLEAAKAQDAINQYTLAGTAG